MAQSPAVLVDAVMEDSKSNATPRHADRSTPARLDVPGPTGSGDGQGWLRGHGCPGWGYLASVSERVFRRGSNYPAMRTQLYPDLWTTGPRKL
jgi:hypothetical protein